MIALPAARKKHRRSVYNWVNGNKPVVRSESGSFLEAVAGEDYVTLGSEGPDRSGFEILLDNVAQKWPLLANYVSVA